MTVSSELRRTAAQNLTRRWFLRDCGVGLASLALAQLLQRDAFASAANPFAPKAPPLPAKAKRIIYLFQAGGPSHLELFDFKPELA